MSVEAFVEVSTSQPFWLLVVSEQAKARKAVRIIGVEFNYERGLVADIARQHKMLVDNSCEGEVRLMPET